tara:strand:+ start:1466 stop:1666 length:201 start_codon:yes stop_codon:yes gene_type:complete
MSTTIKGVFLPDHFWDHYASKVNEYHIAINHNYNHGKITLKEKCLAHQNVDEFFADFYLESAQLIK